MALQMIVIRFTRRRTVYRVFTFECTPESSETKTPGGFCDFNDARALSSKPTAAAVVHLHMLTYFRAGLLTTGFSLRSNMWNENRVRERGRTYGAIVSSTAPNAFNL